MPSNHEDLLSHALYYASLHYRVFPCVPNSPGSDNKNPLTDNGFYAGSIDPAVIEAWWTKWPLANIAIRTEGLIVIDTDPGSTWLAEMPELAADLLDAPQAMTPRGGYHRIFRQPQNKFWGCTQSKLAPKVDTRGCGGYILVAPSHVNDKPYRWINDLDRNAECLPHPPQWLEMELDRIHKPKDPAGGERSDSSEETATVEEGTRNGVLTSMAGQMRRFGMSEPEIRAALHAVNIGRCRPPLEAKEVEKIAWSVTRYAPDQLSVAVMEAHYEQDRQPAKTSKPIEAQLPDDLRTAPGLIEKVAKYTNDTSHRKQPDLAFAGALALMSVLTGRKVCDEQDTRTNLYIFGLAPSGGGKDRARQVNKEILKHAGGLALIGQESFASQQGLFSQVETRKAVLCQVDELGEFLKSIKNPKNSHLHGIIAELLKLYSSANTVYLGPAHADVTRDKSVEQPHLVFYGTTVSESFFDAMTTESITGGFLARAMFFEGPPELQAKVKAVKHGLDPALIEEVKTWVQFNPGGGNLSAESPKPLMLTTSQQAEEIFEKADKDADTKHNDLKAPLGTIWTRLVENAKKLALLHTCSQFGTKATSISGESAEWAIKLATNRCERMQYLAETRVSGSEHEAILNELVRILRDAGPEGLTSREWYRKTRKHPPQKLSEAMKGLTLTGDLVQRSGSPFGGGAGRPSQRHVWGGFPAVTNQEPGNLSRGQITPDGSVEHKKGNLSQFVPEQSGTN